MKKLRRPFWKAFEDGSNFRLFGGARVVTMRSDDVGSLVLPSGFVVCSDPILDPWQRPFSTTVSPGAYPVHVALADGQPALIMVIFDPAEPSFWKRAKPRYISVDSATACLMDHKVARYLRRRADNGKYERFIKRFDDALAEGGRFGVVPIGASSDATIVVFETHGGDGVFPVYFGFGASDAPSCLVIDMLFEPSEAEQI